MTAPDPAHPAFSAVWLDRLVDLHVLAAHGDQEATAAAATWLAGDSEARRTWDAVERTCTMIRETGAGSW